MKVELSLDQYALFTRGEVSHVMLGCGYMLERKGTNIFIIGNGEKIRVENLQQIIRLINLL